MSACGDFTGCGFTNNTNDLYFYLPADSTITASGSGVHCSSATGLGSIGQAIVATQVVDSLAPTPNNNQTLDSQIEIATHETDEAITDPGGTGWHCTIGSNGTEIDDLCELHFGDGPWLGGTDGHQFNFTAGGSNYLVADTWTPGIVNGCYVKLPDTSLVNATVCASTSQCPAPGGWQLGCVSGICTVPTCADGVQDGFETDVDCGGPCATMQVTGPLAPSNGLCALHKKCQYVTDCGAGTGCTAGTCQ